jgi:hypothetical protein
MPFQLASAYLSVMKIFIIISFVFISNYSIGQCLNKDSLINYSYIINGKDSAQFFTSGTGSIVKYKERYYLVTNYHVLTGKECATNKKFPELQDTVTSISIIYQSSEKYRIVFIARIYPIFDKKGNPNFETAAFQDRRLDLSVIPIEIPNNAKKYFFVPADFDSSFTYKDDEELMIFGFPLGHFKNSWQPTELDTKTVVHNELPFTYNPFVCFDSLPIKGMSGSPSYIYDEKGEIKILSILSNQVDFNKDYPRIKGRSIYSSLVLDLIEKMYLENKPIVIGEDYKAK